MDQERFKKTEQLGLALPIARLASSMPEPAAKLLSDALDVLARRVASGEEADRPTGRSPRSTEKLWESFLNRGFAHFRQYGDALKRVVFLTEGLADGRRRSLSETAFALGLSVKAVKRSQSLFWDSILEERRPSGRGSRKKKAKLLPLAKARAARKWFVASFLLLLASRGGSLVVDEGEEEPKTVATLEFLARCSGAGYTRLEGGTTRPADASGQKTRRATGKASLALIGSAGVVTRLGQSYPAESMTPDDVDTAKVSQLLGREESGFVSHDVERLARWICTRRGTTLTREQKVVLALRRLGRPAHYREVAQVYKTLFPEDAATVQSVYSCLLRYSARDGSGTVVWAGGRGVFALSEWGYFRPESPLRVEASDVVARKYSETRRPVPLTVIAAELGERRVVKRSSLLSALLGNPSVKHLGGGLFVPAEPNTADEPVPKARAAASQDISPSRAGVDEEQAVCPGPEFAVVERGGMNLRDGPDVSEEWSVGAASLSTDSLDRALREFERSRSHKRQG